MSNVIISYPDQTILSSLSGGSWQPSLPLGNLKNSLLSKKSRSTNALAASSTILIDLGAAKAIRVISLIAHNITAVGTIRARGYSNSGYTTLVAGADTTTTDAWPIAFTAADVAAYPKNWMFCFTSSKNARYWKIEISDTANAAGYIELGRVWLGTATFEPVTGISFGASLGYESNDIIETSLGNVKWGEQRTPARSLVATFEVLTPAEKRQGLIMQKTLTTIGESLWITNSLATPDDMLLEAFPGTFKSLSALTYPYFDNNTLPIAVTEIV